MRITISIEGLAPISAEIDETDTPTFNALKSALPLNSSVNRWGDEIYFYVDFASPLEEHARSSMKIGEIAYWPQGPAIAIFFGPTPASVGEEPMAASDCNVLGIVESSPEILRKAKDGAKLSITIGD